MYLQTCSTTLKLWSNGPEEKSNIYQYFKIFSQITWYHIYSFFVHILSVSILLSNIGFLQLLFKFYHNRSKRYIHKYCYMGCLAHLLSFTKEQHCAIPGFIWKWIKSYMQDLTGLLIVWMKIWRYGSHLGGGTSASNYLIILGQRNIFPGHLAQIAVLASIHYPVHVQALLLFGKRWWILKWK